MKRIVLLLPILALLFSSCALMQTIVGSGDLVEVDLGYTGFSALDISAAFDVTVIQDDTYSVTVMVDDNVIDKVISYGDKSTLGIGLDNSYRYTGLSLRAVITMPTLSGVILSDAALVTVIDSTSFPSVSSFRATLSEASHLLLPSMVANTVTVKLSGASRVNIGTAASDISITAKDASSIQMNGSCFDLNLTAGDASVATLKELNASGAIVNLDGASEAWVYVNGVLSVDLAGASSLYYRGSVDITNPRIVDASSIEPY